jgi:hypothetical protein
MCIVKTAPEVINALPSAQSTRQKTEGSAADCTAKDIEMFCLQNTSPAKYFNTTGMYKGAEKVCFPYAKPAKKCEVSESNLNDLYTNSAYGNIIAEMKKHPEEMAPEPQLRKAQATFIAGRKRLVSACDVCVGKKVKAYHSLYSKVERVDEAKETEEEHEAQKEKSAAQKRAEQAQKRMEQKNLKNAEKEARLREKEERNNDESIASRASGPVAGAEGAGTGGGCSLHGMGMYCFRSTSLFASSAYKSSAFKKLRHQCFPGYEEGSAVADEWVGMLQVQQLTQLKTIPNCCLHFLNLDPNHQEQAMTKCEVDEQQLQEAFLGSRSLDSVGQAYETREANAHAQVRCELSQGHRTRALVLSRSCMLTNIHFYIFVVFVLRRRWRRRTNQMQ